MPRNPAAKKNQHNNRHENGLVGPGKRVVKQKSNTNLNGNVKPTHSDEPVPAISNIESFASHDQPTLPSDTSKPDDQPSLKKRGSESSTDGQEPKWESTNGSATILQRRSEMAQFKSKNNNDYNAVQIASTILRSCPAGDTIALLIVLLALPSMVLIIVQALFASLTLMPAGNMSPVSFLSLFDVFQGSYGSPSLTVMAIVDVMCLGCWICLWTWAQNFALDLAQIQIAITLGNGNSGKAGTVNMFCFALVLVQHAIRSRGVRQFFVSNLLPSNLISHPRLIELAHFLPAESDFGDSPGSPSKLGSLFAIHILSQAFMAFIRRQIANSQNGSGSKSSKRTDTEAHAGSSNVAEPLHIDTANAGVSSGVDYQPPPTPGFSKDSKEKLMSAKKRRRQANQVRSRQPFWAALASTKVHALREMEHNKGQPGTASEYQNSSTSSQEVVLITSVEPSAIHFEASCISLVDQDYESTLSGDSRPFFVRINGARWHSVNLDPFDDTKRHKTSSQSWSGTISGLAPDCTYTCSFNRIDDEEEFAAIMVKTPAIVDRDVTSALAPAPTRGSLRPSSPTTTLKTSIQNAEVKLNEARARLTRSKRVHKAAVGKIEKEVDTLQSRLKSSSDDTKQRQKLLQAERSMRQTEEATLAIAATLRELEAIPEDEVVDHNEKKTAYNAQSKLVAAANESLEAAKACAKNELSNVTNELTAVTSRKERLVGRQGKLAEQHDRITQANAQGMDEKERKAAEAVRIEAERQRREAEMNNGISALIHDLREIQLQVQASLRETENLERQQIAQREMMLNNSGPLTPEGNLPGTNPPQHRSFAFPGYQSSHLATTTSVSEAHSSPFLAYANTLPGHMRPRSNTNQSLGAKSNFSIDFEDADPIPPMVTNTSFDPAGMNGRNSSGSSRSKNNGSPAAGVIGEALRSPHNKGSYSPVTQGSGVNSW